MESAHALKLIELITLRARYQNPGNMRFRCTNQLYFDIL